MVSDDHVSIGKKKTIHASMVHWFIMYAMNISYITKRSTFILNPNVSGCLRFFTAAAVHFLFLVCGCKSLLILDCLSLKYQRVSHEHGRRSQMCLLVCATLSESEQKRVYYNRNRGLDHTAHSTKKCITVILSAASHLSFRVTALQYRTNTECVAKK